MLFLLYEAPKGKLFTSQGKLNSLKTLENMPLRCALYCRGDQNRL